MPEISVIMGVYNCKNVDLLKKSVESVIAQTYKDWELIICNDGSSDNTLGVLKEIKKLDSRIHIISYKKNHGLAYALNKCLKVAKGKYIARQDDDDYSVINRFEIQLAGFNKHPEYSIIGTNAFVFDDNGVWGNYKEKEYPDKESFLWTNPFAHPTVMIRKDVLDNCNGYRVAKETRRCEDYDLFMRMYSKGYKGMNIQENLYYYRIVNDNKKYRPMKYRIDEAVVRYKGYKILKLFPKGIFFVLKPVLIGLIPQCIFKKIRINQY